MDETQALVPGVALILANCNKVEHDKIIEYMGKLTKERKLFENLPMSL